MSKVYVVTESQNMDYGDAERFGEVSFITRRNLRPCPNSLINQDIKADIAHGCKAFNPDTDYLVLTGSPINIGYAFSEIRKNSPHGFRLLQWNSRSYKYEEYIHTEES